MMLMRGMTTMTPFQAGERYAEAGMTAGEEA